MISTRFFFLGGAGILLMLSGIAYWVMHNDTHSDTVVMPSIQQAAAVLAVETGVIPVSPWQKNHVQSLTSETGTVTPAKTRAVSVGAAPDQQAQDTLDAYFTAWQQKDQGQVDLLWHKVAACDPCLYRIMDMIISGDLAQPLVLDLSYKLIPLGREDLLPVFDYLLDPVNGRNLPIIVAEQMLSDGRSFYVEKFLQQVEKTIGSGEQKFAYQLSWVLANLKNPEGLSPMLNAYLGRQSVTPAYQQQLQKVLKKTINTLEANDSLGSMLYNYYNDATVNEQEQLWPVVQYHSQTLGLLAVEAHGRGNDYKVKHYVDALAKTPDSRSLDVMFQIQKQTGLGNDFFRDYLPGFVRRGNSVDANMLKQLEEYVLNPNLSYPSRTLAADGLLSVKDNGNAKSILNKAIASGDYQNAEIAAYISARL